MSADAVWPGRQRGKRFRVVVADARPEGEGRATLHALLGAGIACTYVLLNSVPLVMQASWSPAISHAHTCIPVNNSPKEGAS